MTVIQEPAARANWRGWMRNDQGTAGDGKGQLAGADVARGGAGGGRCDGAVLLAREPESDLTQAVVGGWIAGAGET